VMGFFIAHAQTREKAADGSMPMPRAYRDKGHGTAS
jgi:hypothetical protein